jgi:hypothetical protein
MRWNNKVTPPPLRVARAYYPGPPRMPRTWIYSLVVLVACLLASMVIAIVKLT